MSDTIGQLSEAEKMREVHRVAYKTAKSPQDKAQAKRDFRKARNRVLCLKEEMKK